MSAHHEEANAGGKKTIPQILFWFLLVFVVPYLVITTVISALLPNTQSVPYPASHPEVTAKRIQKVGAVEMKNVNREAKSGEEVYAAQCGACHAAGVAGAPKFGDKAAWAPRLGAGVDGLTASVIKGKGAMPPKGGSGASDAEIKAAVEFMTAAAK